jgi:endoglucanase
LDYNAPLLTLAAMHALADSKDPFYTSLKGGAYQKVKPSGFPCDAAFDEGCKGPQLSRGGTIAMAVSLVVVGLIILGLTAYWVFLVRRNNRTTINTY